MQEKKQRLDTALAERKIARSRSAAADLIKRGKVFVNGILAEKASAQVSKEDVITTTEENTYVSRGGLKLLHALDVFGINVRGLVCVDIGSSTGGFTDCLLQKGAAKVYAIDVGSEQLDPSLRNDPRVVLLEQTDVRNATIPEACDIGVIDVSFISATHILEDAMRLTKDEAHIVVLVKPQFEVGKDLIGKDGIVKDKLEQEKSLQKVAEFGKKIGLKVQNTTESPIEGGDGNKEYFIHFSK